MTSRVSPSRSPGGDTRPCPVPILALGGRAELYCVCCFWHRMATRGGKPAQQELVQMGLRHPWYSLKGTKRPFAGESESQNTHIAPGWPLAKAQRLLGTLRCGGLSRLRQTAAVSRGGRELRGGSGVRRFAVICVHTPGRARCPWRGWAAVRSRCPAGDGPHVRTLHNGLLGFLGLSSCCQRGADGEQGVEPKGDSRPWF